MFASLLLLSSAALAEPHLPPLMPWKGSSEQLMQQDGPLTTDFEKSAGQLSPNYSDTMAYLMRLVAANPTQFAVAQIGTSAQGRAINMLVASEHGIFGNHAISVSEKPTLLIQAGIHAGEIDGKDAGFMLLRDIATGKRRDILQKVNLLFIPILNVDGHERSGPFNRINQRGPVEMGFRTNASNLNLNRDYAKLDTRGIRAVSRVVNQYNPDLYLDIHVTDGEDYQYDVTYGANPTVASASPAIARVLGELFTPEINQRLLERGHEPGPLVFAMDNRDFAKGIAGWSASPRYSNGWGDIRGLPTILVENHSLKPYRRRVLGTYVFIDAVISSLTKNQKPLADAVAADTDKMPEELVLEWGSAKTPDYISFKGISYRNYHSEITGQNEVEWTGKPVFYEKLPVYWQSEIKTRVKVPSAFYIPAQYTEVLDTLNVQGIEIERIEKHTKLPLNELKATSYTFADSPFEGRLRVAATWQSTEHAIDVNGWYKVSTAQPLGKLAVHLLHPKAPDSLFQWGAFNTIFQRTEYVENYALIPYIKEVFKRKPALKAEYEALLASDKAFAADPKARQQWLYSHTPYYDKRYLVYPVRMEYKGSEVQ